MKTQAVLHNPKELKPYQIPDGFTILEDTREQKPLSEFWPDDLPVLHAALKDGDYSILGYEDRFCVERKGMSDFYSYIGKERKAKTMPKMLRFQEMDWVGLAIELSEKELLFGNMISKLEPEHVRGALTSFRVRFGLHVYFSKSREYVARWTLDSALKFYKMMREGW